MVAVELITELSELRDLEPQWDDLAVASRLPMMSPACVMAWWRHLAPASARPRVVVVKEGDTLVGIAPFYVNVAKPHRRLDLRLPGIELSPRLSPLALPGREPELAQAIMQSARKMKPQPDLIALEGMPLSLNWASELNTHSSGWVRPIPWQYQKHSCPVVTLGAESLDGWLATKSSHFRQGVRRERRKFEAAGGSARMSDPSTLRADVDMFMRLHAQRWESRGRSNLIALGAGLPDMLEDMGSLLLMDDGRFRLQVLEVEGEPVATQLCLAAGGYVVGTVAGWDERFASLRPGNVGMLVSIEEALARGDEYFDMGVVDQAYKLRFTDTSAPVGWTVIILPGARFPLTCIGVAAMVAKRELRNVAKRAMTREQAERYRRLGRPLRKQ